MLRSCDTNPMKGFVRKFTKKITMAMVTTKGRRITRPVIKYFFIKARVPGAFDGPLHRDFTMIC